jgi:integrase
VARQLSKLKTRFVQTVKKAGRHSDGGGLFLVVSETGAKSWVFMSWAGGRQIEHGLGGLASVTLAMARERAAACRRHVAEGRNPIEARKAKAVPTFGGLAKVVIASLQSGWRNDKHRAQWRSTLATYAAPLARKRVDAITTEDVLAVLKPVWTAKAETAGRLRGRIEKILDAAKAKGHRTGENPARWRGHLDHLLPKRQKLQRGHHAAMPWKDVPAFIARLRSSPAISSLALEFVILTASRTGEVLRSVRDGVVMGARWDEIDRDARIWTVPAMRMKMAREHRVPLTNRMLAILDEAKKLRSGPFIFPSARGNESLSEMALEMLMRRLNAKPATVHGFRSAFRDWAGDATHYSRELAEKALAHKVGDETELAYRRSDALEKRRALMKAWSAFCEPKNSANVIPMSRRS